MVALRVALQQAFHFAGDLILGLGRSGKQVDDGVLMGGPAEGA
jgi:hypothetical protein